MGRDLTIYAGKQCTWFRNTEIFSFRKTHPQWKHTGFSMTLKSTTSSLNVANVSASLGLANSAIIPTDWGQMMREPGLPWKYRAVTSEVPTGESWQGWVTPGSRTCLRGTRPTGTPRLPRNGPTPLPSDGCGTIFLTWRWGSQARSWTSEYRHPQARRPSLQCRLSKDAVVPTTMTCPRQQAPSGGLKHRPTSTDLINGSQEAGMENQRHAALGKGTYLFQKKRERWWTTWIK